MAGTLDLFTTFWESTGPRYLKGLKDLINEEQKHTYTLPRLKSGHVVDEMIQAGSTIKDRIFLKVESTYERIDPTHRFQYDNKQTGTDWEVAWSIGAGYVVWNKWEKSLNFNGGGMTDAGLAHIFKDVMTQKMQNMYTDYCNQRDAECWAVPDKSKMEVSQGNAAAPYSIPVFINEFANGLAAASDQPGGAWTTIQGLNPTAAATNSKWDCPRKAYEFEATAGNSAPLFDAMRHLWMDLEFDKLPDHASYGEMKTSPTFIATSKQGVINYEHALRENQDLFRGRGAESGQDPAYPGPTFMGLPIQRVSELETAAIYPTGASDALSTELDNTNNPSTAGDPGFAGPRYYMLNGQYLKPVYHSDDYFSWTEVMTPPEKPFDRVQVYSTTNNLICRSRQRAGGILYPLNDVVANA